MRVLDLFYIVFKGNPKPQFVETLEVLFWDLKDIVASSFKVTTKNHSHTIITGRSEVAATRSTIVDDLNFQRWS